MMITFSLKKIMSVESVKHSTEPILEKKHLTQK